MRKSQPGLSQEEKEFWKAHCKENGLWKQFIARRESLKENDISGAAAWLQSAESLGYVHHEDPKRGHLTGVECPLCDSQDQVRTADSLEVTPTDDIPPDDDVPLEKAKTRSKIGHFGIADAMLMPKEMALAKPKQEITLDVGWVIEHLGVAGMKPQDAPTAKAWSMFVEAKQGAEGFRMVMQHHQKMMPTGKQLDAEKDHGNLGPQRMAEFKAWLDAPEQTSLLTRDVVLQESAEIVPTERVVSRKDLVPGR